MNKSYIYGINTVKEFLYSSKRVKKIITTPAHKEVIEFCKKKNVNFEIKDNYFFKKVSSHSQGLVAEVEPFSYVNLDLLKKLDQNATLLILDQIQDPHNFGAIIRTAAASGVSAIIVANKNQVDVTSTVERVAVGTTNKIKIIKVANITNTIAKLKQEKFWVYGTSLSETSVDYRQIDYKGKTAIVIGSEGKGIKPIIQKACDQNIVIPLKNNVESLNASVATAVVLYHIYGVKNPL